MLTRPENRVSIIEFAYLYRTDWNKSVKEAERRNASA